MRLACSSAVRASSLEGCSSDPTRQRLDARAPGGGSAVGAETVLKSQPDAHVVCCPPASQESSGFVAMALMALGPVAATRLAWCHVRDERALRRGRANTAHVRPNHGLPVPQLKSAIVRG